MPEGAGSDRAAGLEARRFGRREFLRGAGATGLGITLIGSRSAVASTAAASARLPHVYRLSNRGMVVCNGCKGHDAHRYFRRSRFADHGRAHKGCDCRIVAIRIPKRQWNLYFLNPDGSLRREWDDRW
jgi:hypothetical protein